MSSDSVLEIQLSAEASVTARLYTAKNADGVPVLICPAMGVRAQFYDGVASELAKLGHTVLVADLRGIGGSNLRAREGADFGYADIIGTDLPALVAVLTERVGRRPILFGHSLGGQLGCVYAGQAPDSVAGIALIASCSVYFRNWPRRAQPGLWAFYHFAKATAARLGYWPGPRFRFGGYEARTLVADWARQGLTGRYDLASIPNAEAAMARVQHPILAINLSDDRWAPTRATEHLLSKLRSAPVTRRTLQPAELKLDVVKHFGWRKRPEAIAEIVHRWAQEAGLR